MKVLIFSAHPDDETLGMGGTILKHRANGDDVFWCVFTIAFRNSDSEYIRIRNNIVRKVADAYGFTEFFNLGFPAAELDKVGFRDMIDKTIEVIKTVKPDIVYTVGCSDVNTDHDVVYRSIMIATKPSYSFIKEIYAYEIPSSTNWAFPDKSTWFEPQVYVDIERYFSKKLEILSLYEDQIFEFPHARSLKAVEALAMYRGSSVGMKYAEAFKVLRIVR